MIAARLLERRGESAAAKLVADTVRRIVQVMRLD
jgi:hypothetical protein